MTFWLQFSFVLPLAATVVGWIVVSRQNDLRIRRQEIRGLIEEVRERCDRAVDATDEYWSTTTSYGQRYGAAVKLKACFPGIARILKSIQAAGLTFDGWALLVAMRQAATGEEFERKGRRVKAEDRDRVLDTSIAAEDLIGALDQAYFSQFPIRPRRRWLALSSPLVALGLVQDTADR